MAPGVADKRIMLRKQPTETNAADLVTKYLPKARVGMRLGVLGLSLIQEAAVGPIAIVTRHTHGQRLDQLVMLLGARLAIAVFTSALTLIGVCV